MRTKNTHKIEKSVYQVFHSYHKANIPNLTYLIKTSRDLKFSFYFYLICVIRNSCLFTKLFRIFFCLDTIDGRSFPTGTLVYELTLSNKVMSYSRDDPKHFELLWMLLFLYIPIFCHCQFHFSEQRWAN